jgi:hypothetical protein
MQVHTKKEHKPIPVYKPEPEGGEYENHDLHNIMI